MSQKYEKLKSLLMELFQLDQPDLDFGLYRIMHAKSAEVTQFLDEDLLPQVKEAFALYQSADRAEIEKELGKVVAGIEAAGMNPEESPKVRQLRDRLAHEAIDVDGLESEVYDHLFSFFRRYYSEGDFLSKRVYKPGVYAIPYEGEEVKLHWANADQYYIKTSEYLRDYAFRLRPDDEEKPMRVHFRLVDAAEGEHGNVKAAEGKDRRFKLAETDTIALDNGELFVRFTYQPDPTKQKELNADAEAVLLETTDPQLAEWIRELRSRHSRVDDTESESTRLRVHLDRYTARNTFDYFIHKDLGAFLRRELDFYIKNEVMHLDDIENESAPRVEQYLSKVKVIRRIAGKIIAFLAQLEDFQKKLWLKKKFVVETSWCIRLGCIPEELYAEIAANEAQCEEWVELNSIEEIKGDLTTPGYSKKLKPEFLREHPTLVVDTRHFDHGFCLRLLDSIDELEEKTDGVLFHSENFQALSSMRARYQKQVKCVYIDPPYNTGNDSFAYRDAYQHSSWLTMASSRLVAADTLLEPAASVFVSVDDHEAARLIVALEAELPRSRHVTNLIWQKVDSPNDNKVPLTPDHEYVLCFSTDLSLGHFRPKSDLSILDAYRANPDGGARYRDRLLKKNGANSLRSDRPTMYYAVVDPDGNEVFPLHDDGTEACWALGQSAVRGLIESGDLVWKRRVVAGTERWEPYTREYAPDMPTRPFPTIWNDVKTMRQAKAQLRALFGGISAVETVKPTQLVERLQALSGNDSGLLLDYFAGSGTTGHAVVNLNREDGGRRRFILVEMGDYFDTVLLPRLKKVTFSPEWKDGKPKRLATPVEAERSPRIMKVVRLESYEDALNNLESRRSQAQEQMLLSPEAQSPDGLKEQYVLRYMLDVETRGSQSLLYVQAFADPTAYTLMVKRPSSDESREVKVDLVETFNWLIGLTVKHMAAPQTLSAVFERDGEKRLRLKGRLKEDAAGPYWFRTVTGTTPDGRRTLVIWRKLTGNPEEDNLALDEWFTKQGYSSKDSEFDLIYVNGGNNLENLKTPNDLWKVRLIEEDFHRLMFEGEGP